MVETINIDELRKLIDENGDYVLIDVRRSDELNHGVIPSSVHLPMDDIQFALTQMESNEFRDKYGFEKPEKNDNIIFYCRTGSRSGMVTGFANKEGYHNAKNFEGSVQEWSTIDDNVEMYD